MGVNTSLTAEDGRELRAYVVESARGARGQS